MRPKTADGMANSVDYDQTTPEQQSDQGLHCLLSLMWVCTVCSV